MIASERSLGWAGHVVRRGDRATDVRGIGVGSGGAGVIAAAKAAVPPAEIAARWRDIRVAATLVAGRIVHDAL